MPSALAIAAHPDDIEYVMAGTLLQLKAKGWDIHYFNLANGNRGSMTKSTEEMAAIRLEEAIQAAKVLGATFHPPIANDLEIFFNLELHQKVSHVVRKVQPNIVLTHSPQDYMEDHMNACRLAVLATFSRQTIGLESIPYTQPCPPDHQVALYHAMPHGLRDQLGEPVTAQAYVNIEPVHDNKRSSLEAHTSQGEWLTATQKMPSFVQVMVDQDAEVGRQSKKFQYAEGWRQHLHLGFGAPDYNPLRDVLGEDYLPHQK